MQPVFCGRKDVACGCNVNFGAENALHTSATHFPAQKSRCTRVQCNFRPRKAVAFACNAISGVEKALHLRATHLTAPQSRCTPVQRQLRRRKVLARRCNRLASAELSLFCAFYRKKEQKRRCNAAFHCQFALKMAIAAFQRVDLLQNYRRPARFRRHFWSKLQLGRASERNLLLCFRLRDSTPSSSMLSGRGTV